MEIRIKIRNEQIKYNISNGFSIEENSFLASAIRQAYITAYNSRMNLEKDNDMKIKNFAKAIFGSDDFSVLRKNIEDIVYKIRSGKLRFLKQKIFEKNGKTNGSILASVEKDENFLIKIYLSFFDMKKFKDDRSGVIIHEIAHLCGLEREKEKFSLESAEALKNFCLLCDGKISLEQLNSEKNNPENENSDEMTYRSNPNRDENGRFDVGPDNGSSESATGEKSKSNGKKTNASKSKFVERGKINDAVKPNGELANQKAKQNMDAWKKEKDEWKKACAKAEKEGKPFPSEPKKPETSPEESQYVKDIKEKYKGYSREVDPDEVKDIIKEVCEKLAEETGFDYLNSDIAKELVFGTAAVESDMRARTQDGGGPALGLFQMEYETFRDLVADANTKPKIQNMISVVEKEFNNDKKLEFEDLIKNDKIAAAMARIKYASIPKNLEAKDTKGLAEYWKNNYNSSRGAGKEKDFIDKYNKYKNPKK